MTIIFLSNYYIKSFPVQHKTEFSTGNFSVEHLPRRFGLKICQIRDPKMQLRGTFFCIILSWCYVDATQETCKDKRAIDFKFSVTSVRNSTGQWTARAELERVADRGVVGNLAPEEWELDVEQTTVKCEDQETVITVATVSGADRKLGPGYELVPGVGYYKLHTKARNWQDARSICVEEGAHLAIVNSDKEAAVFGAMLVRNPDIEAIWKNDWAYLGFHDQYSEGEFVTVFNQPLNSTGFEKWYPSQPANNTRENCGLINKDKTLLGDTECYRLLPFFCEREL
ncbi:hemolymph lipopolysaccharide-binding protein-like [Periplaneta americana]|uniref:hemolymph lipopolysaccharide-binding protein-like n=1 Tax=Periplaneta americana TaxID=6978 RepID=UPI0037E83FE2